VAVETDIDEVHRLTAGQYHLIESEGLDEDTRVELIDGLILDMSPKTPAPAGRAWFLPDKFT